MSSIVYWEGTAPHTRDTCLDEVTKLVWLLNLMLSCVPLLLVK